VTAPIKPNPGYKRIATEEAWAPPELIAEFQRLVSKKIVDDPAFLSLWGYYGSHPSDRAQQLLHKIQQIDETRIADMDASGIDMQLLLLTAPGVQVLEKGDAVAMAKLSTIAWPRRVASSPPVSPLSPR
jgi:2,3-dihydroxybenzoate decarboxylase